MRIGWVFAPLAVLAACHGDRGSPAPRTAPPAGPYHIRYSCFHSDQPFGPGEQQSELVIDLGAKTRSLLETSRTDAPGATPPPRVAPPPDAAPVPTVTRLSDATAAAIASAAQRVLAGGPYKPELPVPEGTSCTLSITQADGAKLFEIDKSRTEQADAVSELVQALDRTR